MNKEIAIYQDLISDLDEARIFQHHVCARLNRPWLKHLLEKFARTHTIIAEDLADRIRAFGVRPVRTGHRFSGLRNRHAEWRARLNIDVELGYVIQIERYEGRVAQHLSAAALRIHDGGIRRQIQFHQRELERAHTEIGRFRQLMQSQEVAA